MTAALHRAAEFGRNRGGGRRSGESRCRLLHSSDSTKSMGTVQTAFAPRSDARIYLTHFVGSGLDDERYVVQRYLPRANGDIVPVD